MANPTATVISFTTTSGGAATAYSTVLRGTIIGLSFSISAMDAGSVFTVTTETQGQAIMTLTASNTDAIYRPVSQLHTSAAALIADTFDYPRVHDDRVKVVVASGGDTKSGTLTVFTE